MSLKDNVTYRGNLLVRPRLVIFVAIARKDSTSTTISTITPVIAGVGGTVVYMLSRAKKCSMRLNTSRRVSRNADASLAAWNPSVSRQFTRVNQGRYRPTGELKSQQRLLLPARIPEKQVSEQTFPPWELSNNHQTNTLAKCSGKCVEDIDRRDEPVCESLVSTLGLIGCEYLFSKDGQNRFGGIASLKTGK